MPSIKVKRRNVIIAHAARLVNVSKKRFPVRQQQEPNTSLSKIPKTLIFCGGPQELNEHFSVCKRLTRSR